MKLTEALNIIRHHQLWRLGDEITMLHPKVITEAINVILAHHKVDRYTKHEFLNAAELGEVSLIDARHIVRLLDEVREKNNQ